MTAKVLEFRLRKIEKQVTTSAYSRLSDAALDAAVRAQVDVLTRPYNGNLVATADAYRASPTPHDREIARHLDDIIADFHDLYPAAG